LKAAFGDTIGQVLQEVALHSTESPKAAVLEIALACSHLVGHRTKSRTSLYSQTQSLLAAVYKLITVTAAQENINIEDVDGVDVRVLLLAWSSEGESEPPNETPYGPVIDLASLARCGRSWQFAFGVESEEGENMVRQFVTAKGSVDDLERVPSGPVMNSQGSSRGSATAGSQNHEMHYDVAVGGTWDHLHIGHKLLITMTIFLVDERIASKERSAVIGITGDKLLVNKKHATLVESWADRQRAVATFFNSIIDFSSPASSTGHRHVSIRDEPVVNGKSVDVSYPNGLVVKCTEIQDPFGPTITEEQISALVISAETRSGGKAVNDKRKEQSWKELDVFEVDVLDADDESGGEGVKEGFDSKISSTAIREKLARKAGEKL
jgi:phosphopantetheine adenylyltransferase